MHSKLFLEHVWVVYYVLCIVCTSTMQCICLMKSFFDGHVTCPICFTYVLKNLLRKHLYDVSDLKGHSFEGFLGLTLKNKIATFSLGLT